MTKWLLGKPTLNVFGRNERESLKLILEYIGCNMDLAENVKIYDVQERFKICNH